VRYKVFALTVATWAQTSTQTTPSTPQQSTVPAEKAVCDKMSACNATDAHSCCARPALKSEDDKATASCCAGKDAMAGGQGCHVLHEERQGQDRSLLLHRWLQQRQDGSRVLRWQVR
jgi:hypothetical protein